MPRPNIDDMSPDELLKLAADAAAMAELKEEDSVKEARAEIIAICERVGKPFEEIMGLKKKRGRKKSNSSAARDLHAQH